MVDQDEYRQAIARDVDLVLDASTDLDAGVPSCPKWAVRDLLRHLGKVQRWATACLRAEPGVESARPPGPPDGTDPREWFREGADALLETLATADLAAPVHTWAGPRPGAWWLRRLTHETAIHRWDAQSATGVTTGFDPALAVDGVAEHLDEFARAFADVERAGDEQASLHLHATDAEGEWFIEFGPDGVAIEAAHRKADVAVRGAAGALFLLVWRRGGLDDVEVIGDPTVLDRWSQVVVI